VEIIGLKVVSQCLEVETGNLVDATDPQTVHEDKENTPCLPKLFKM
jgi:hypothetical protein